MRTHSSHTPRRRFAAALGAAALVLPAGIALAADAGDADPAFGQRGRTILPTDLLPGDAVALPDGGALLTDRGRLRFARVRADGSYDDAFGALTKLPVDEPGHFTAVARQPDGKILLAGMAQGKSFVMRLLEDGTSDVTFDPGGGDGSGTKVGGLASDTADAMVAQPDGRIVVVGRSSGKVTATRLNPDGSVDAPAYEVTPAGMREVTVTAAALGPAGALVVGGTSRGMNADDNLLAIRWTPAGRLDTSFGTDGIVDDGLTDRMDTGLDMAVQPDGKVVFVGDSGSQSTEIAVTRLDTDGSVDSDFGVGGRALPQFAGSDTAADLCLQPDGRILVTGTAEREFAVARLDADGDLDQTFGAQGRVAIPFADIAEAATAVLAPGGRLIVAGATATENRTKVRTAVARLLGDPPVVPTPTVTATVSATASPQATATVSATPTSAADTTPPVLTGLEVVAGRRARVRLTMSEAGRVELALRRRGRVTRASRPASAGSNRLQVGRKLTAGRYRLVAAPFDAAGNAGVARRVRFAVR